MPRKRFKTEEIIQKLREAEVLLSQGRNVSEACRQIGVTDNTYYRWRNEYGIHPQYRLCFRCQINAGSGKHSSQTEKGRVCAAEFRHPLQPVSHGHGKHQWSDRTNDQAGLQSLTESAAGVFYRCRLN